ncbi:MULTISPECIES: c-type cytochrome [Tabrizicola]|uniref:c-type cytochrome n=1 Tax=Tabrizicola TaxID=1443919 RepID=UPI001F0D6A8A|nr:MULTISPECIES: cytochrome c [Paracoccaceae]
MAGKQPFASLNAEDAMIRGMVMALLMGQATAAWAEGEVTVGNAGDGKVLFQKHCAVCHGTAATGNGPMAPVLLIQPADLTTLVARHGGVFPLERVAARIDGRDPLVSHGSDMPIYGDFFEGQDVTMKTHTGQPLMTSQPIADLVAWLLTVQR